ncbi:hypothetical protein DPMN_126027 [Dreissena polymorpha]|uniref:Uncharacterized protein n=1 Tax=Dreissena polymorpha TaxID=45954 RepID=A0A9D4JU34_DREPO|nr:hypothetical protein DPMN_124445 [Dreissena polymorpha]KAH3824196.1 hypothetical protein DPMN_126027 [Dreissena polymorpha]
MVHNGFEQFVDICFQEAFETCLIDFLRCKCDSLVVAAAVVRSSLSQSGSWLRSMPRGCGLLVGFRWSRREGTGSRSRREGM